MFNKLKQLKDLRSQAKTMQDALAQEKISTEKKGVKITMDGNMNIVEITIENELNKEELASAFKEATNEAIKKTQKNMAQKVQQMGGIPGLS